jgi:hypothetical protein
VEEYANITQQYLNLTKQYATQYIGTEETRQSYLNYTKSGLYAVMSVGIIFFVLIVIIYSFGIGAILVDKKGCKPCLQWFVVFLLLTCLVFLAILVHS